MSPNLQIDEIASGEKAHLVLVRKYRQNEKTHYMFYAADTHKTVSKELAKWLSKNVIKHFNKEVEIFRPGNTPGYLHLNSVGTWLTFKEKAFSFSLPSLSDLNKIKSNLVAYIIFIKRGNTIFGQFRRISSKHLLSKEGLYTLFFQDASFNELRRENGIELDEYADCMFKITPEKSEAIILNEFNFNVIFDLYEQQKEEALDTVNTCEHLSTHADVDTIRELVKNDRMLQRMLSNPLVRAHKDEITFEIIRKVKEEIPERVAFEIDEKNKKIILPDKTKKEAIRSLIKVISYKYSQTFDQKHVLEGTPSEMIK